MNASVDLKSLDGITVQDISPGVFSSTLVTFAARGGGLDAAGITIAFGGTPSIYKNPSREMPLNSNGGDLQPRNHLYVSAGVASLNHTFGLDTTALADGYHELTAVAFEGTHVHTQTRATLPIAVQNTGLGAIETLLDLLPTNSVWGTYHIQVSANTNAISSIELYSTGGRYAFTTNQAASSFNVDGSYFGAGVHPFYAVITAGSGKQFRTRPQLARFVP